MLHVSSQLMSFLGEQGTQVSIPGSERGRWSMPSCCYKKNPATKGGHWTPSPNILALLSVLIQGAFLTFPRYRFAHKACLNLLPVCTVQAHCRRRYIYPMSPVQGACAPSHCRHHLGPCLGPCPRDTRRMAPRRKFKI